jgi:hypothetical protein
MDPSRGNRVAEHRQQSGPGDDVTRRLGPLLVAAALGCSGLTESEGGVVGIEIGVPGPDSVEVGESIQLTVKPINKNGDSVAAPVAWISADTTATIDPASGVLTGVSPGPARIQASVGSLRSPLITFTVVTRPDSLVLAGDSIVTVPAGTTTSPGLLTRLDTFTPPGPVVSGRVVYAITSPDPAAAPPPVVFAGGAAADTVLTGGDGTATATVTAIAAPPDTVIVQVRATRLRGTDVPGSGQRFVVVFQH